MYYHLNMNGTRGFVDSQLFLELLEKKFEYVIEAKNDKKKTRNLRECRHYLLKQQENFNKKKYSCRFY